MKKNIFRRELLPDPVEYVLEVVETGSWKKVYELESENRVVSALMSLDKNFFYMILSDGFLKKVDVKSWKELPYEGSNKPVIKHTMHLDSSYLSSQGDFLVLHSKSSLDGQHQVTFLDLSTFKESYIYKQNGEINKTLLIQRESFCSLFLKMETLSLFQQNKSLNLLLKLYLKIRLPSKSI